MADLKLTNPPLSPWIRRDRNGMTVCIAVQGKRSAEVMEVPLSRGAAFTMIHELVRGLAESACDEPLTDVRLTVDSAAKSHGCDG